MAAKHQSMTGLTELFLVSGSSQENRSSIYKNYNNIKMKSTQFNEIQLNNFHIFLKNRFNFQWNLEEQIKRTEEFEKRKQQILYG